jgi:hypothetical protein
MSPLQQKLTKQLGELYCGGALTKEQRDRADFLMERVHRTGSTVLTLFDLAHAALGLYSKAVRGQIKTDRAQHIESAAADQKQTDLSAKRAALQAQLAEVDTQIGDCKAEAALAADAAAAASTKILKDREVVSLRIIAEKGRQESVCEACSLYFDTGSVCEVAGCDHHLRCPDCDGLDEDENEDEPARIAHCDHCDQQACTRYRHWDDHKDECGRRNSNRCGYYALNTGNDKDRDHPDYEFGWTIWSGHCGKVLLHFDKQRVLPHSNNAGFQTCSLPKDAGNSCSVCEWKVDRMQYYGNKIRSCDDCLWHCSGPKGTADPRIAGGCAAVCCKKCKPKDGACPGLGKYGFCGHGYDFDGDPHRDAWR